MLHLGGALKNVRDSSRLLALLRTNLAAIVSVTRMIEAKDVSGLRFSFGRDEICATKKTDNASGSVMLPRKPNTGLCSITAQTKQKVTHVTVTELVDANGTRWKEHDVLKNISPALKKYSTTSKVSDSLSIFTKKHTLQKSRQNTDPLCVLPPFLGDRPASYMFLEMQIPSSSVCKP